METLTLNLLPTILNSLQNSTNRKEALASLKKLFLIECRINQKILATTQWEGVSDDFKKEMIKSLESGAAKALFSFADKSISNFLFEIISTKNDWNKTENELLIVSIISKIEVLKILSKIKSKLQSENRTIYKMRINNLEKTLSEIASKLEQEI
jgi:hypothetical protein